MANLTNFGENKVVDAVFRGQALGAPANWHIGLFTAAPGEAGGGTEVSGGSYARVSVAASLAAWAGTQSAGSTTASSGTGGVTSNNGAIVFGPASADWGTITHIGFFDASSGGNLWIYAPLAASQVVNNGGTLTIAAGSLTATVA